VPPPTEPGPTTSFKRGTAGSGPATKGIVAFLLIRPYDPTSSNGPKRVLEALASALTKRKQGGFQMAIYETTIPLIPSQETTAEAISFLDHILSIADDHALIADFRAKAQRRNTNGID
jgi:hypothetical protein